MATRSSFFLAILLIANPFMLLVFQNCTPSNHQRAIASENQTSDRESEVIINVDKNLKIK